MCSAARVRLRRTAGGRALDGGTAAPSAAPEAPAERIAAGAYAGPVDIGGGRQIYLECRGTGAPTVVLISGYHDSADLWSISDAAPPAATEAVLPGLAGRYRVCAFDQPGTLRYSENQGSVTTRTTPVPMPRTAADVVADLHEMLLPPASPGPTC